MSRGRRVDALEPAQLQIPIRLFDRVRAAYGLPDMPVIVADEIARQIDALPDTDESPPAAEYGCVAPPFRRFFVEATKVSTRAERVALPGRPGRYETIPPGTTQRGLAVYDASDPIAAELQIPPEVRRRRPADTRWTLACYGFHYFSPYRRLNIFSGPLFLHLDQAGRILDDTRHLPGAEWRGAPLALLPPDVEPQMHVGSSPYPTAMLANHIPFAFKAISAMHKRCAVDHVEPDRAARRRVEQKERIKLHSYYVLKVKPTPERGPASFRQVGRPAEQVAGMREHKVRGHFRFYWPERPLFGRLAGSIWISEHKRGKDQWGDIRKDYEPAAEPVEGK